MSKSPSVRYFEKILFPLMKNFGVEASVEIKEEGFYPWGGGEAEIKVEPVLKKFFNFRSYKEIVKGTRIEAN